MTHQRKIPVIIGPTSSGKTALAIRLAKQRGGEVISGDSRQVYRGLDISTGKVTPEEANGIPHHLIDIRHPNDPITTEEWRDLAETAIADIESRGRLPIIAGGTGFYITALLHGTIFPEVPPNESLRKELEQKTTTHLSDLLQKLDPRRYATIDHNNRHRLIRAIEIATALGSVPKVTTTTPKHDFEIITLLPDRNELKATIKERTEKRLTAGMVDEIKHVHDTMGVSWERLEQLGFDQKYTAQYLRGNINHDTMVELIQRDNWRYAKRQYTWIKNQII